MVVLLRVLLLALIFSSPAFAGPEKLDPLLRALIWAREESGPRALLGPQVLPALLSASWTEEPALPQEGPSVSDRVSVRIFLLTRNPGTAHTLPGVRVHQVAGSLATGVAPLDGLAALAEHPEVVFIQASRPVYPSLDRSVAEAGVPALWYATPSTTGQGVIVGLVDSGIDMLHRDFRVDRDGSGAERGSRILYLWDQTAPGGGRMPPWWGDALGEPRYGGVYSREELEAFITVGTSPSQDTLGHGTHVAGIVAGDGSSSTLNLRGVAPGAELVVVKTTFYEDGVVDGVRFIFEAARALGKPAVVNLSLGGHGGPHDGTSLFEQMLDALLDRPGRAIVVAAGNEGNRKIHVGGEVRTPTTWRLVAEGATVPVNLWYPGTAAFSVTVAAPSGETVTAPPGTQRGASTPSGSVWIDNSSLLDPRNSSKTIALILSGASRGSVWSLTLNPILGGGRVDGWVENPASGWFQEGDTNYTIAEPGNARRVITVGAYVTKNRWVSVAGEQKADLEIGALAAFSSRGPTRDGRLKPDLAAPGAWIASARSRAAQVSPWLALPDGEHSMLLGTSMAAPHVAGAVALIFSRWPNLSWQEVKEALVRGARTDAFVGTAPNHAWGMGKLYAPLAAELAGGGPAAEGPVLFVLGNPVSREASFRYRCPQGVAWAQLHIYDLAGRLLFRQDLSGVEGEVRWPLTASDGRPVASGLYLGILVTDRGRSSVVRLVVQR